MKVLRVSVQIVTRLARELAGVLLVVGLVIALAALPPMRVAPSPASFLDHRVDLDTGAWGRHIVGYTKMLASGTLGRDHYGTPVADMLGDRLGHSLTLMGIALFFALTLGVAKGIWDFRQLRRKRMPLGPLINGAVQGLPDFLLAFLLQYAAVKLFEWVGWRPFPVAWMSDQPGRSMVFPVICLTLIPWAYVARLTSTAMSQIWDEDYIRTAHSKGLADAIVVYKHAFRNALILILEGLPNLLVVMVSNLLIVEYLFGMPGLTILLKDAVKPFQGPLSPGVSEVGPAADMPVLAAAGITLCLVFTVLYATVTALRRLSDPRLKERDAA